MKYLNMWAYHHGTPGMHDSFLVLVEGGDVFEAVNKLEGFGFSVLDHEQVRPVTLLPAHANQVSLSGLGEQASARKKYESTSATSEPEE